MKQLLAIFCTALLFITPVSAASLTLSAPSAILMEKETGSVLYQKDEHKKLEPASVTKVMTMLLVMEAIDGGQLGYDDVLTISAHACSMGGSQIWLKEGEKMSVRDLVKAVFVVSANDAAVALAEQLCGSEEAFVEKMNRRAAELSMGDTSFKNCTGLPAEGHVTSSADIAKMSRALILDHPGIREFTTLWMDSLRDGASVLVNTNKLVRFYDGTTGLKTGSTGAARYCLSATAEKNGMELIAVVLNAPTSAERFEDAKTLLNYGFGAYALTRVLPDRALPPVDVALGVRAAVQPIVSGENALLLPKEQAAALEKNVTLCEALEAPVTAGQKMGELTVTSGGKTLATLPIVAGESVARLSVGQMFLRLLKIGFLAP